MEIFLVCPFFFKFFLYVQLCLKKKVIKAQNPDNSFYFQTDKCIGNTTHSIPNQNMNKNLIEFVITLQKVKKTEYYNLGCSNKIEFSLQTQTFLVNQ